VHRRRAGLRRACVHIVPRRVRRRRVCIGAALRAAAPRLLYLHSGEHWLHLRAAPGLGVS